MGKHFIGIGSYRQDMRELPKALFREVDRVYIDSEHALQESGDLIDPLDSGCIRIENIVTIGKLIKGEVTIGKETPSFFKSAGMAVFDLVSAQYLYTKAKEKGIGTELEL
jgi:ornithine cyclodeaminase